ncbi:MAG TPA: DUF4398 domain-containing protein [Polyangiaceae bacterium]|jgi:hypothetical protein|nr:DUF4398 domain-containing protein [Polyangiaceae bacterium]
MSAYQGLPTPIWLALAIFACGGAPLNAAKLAEANAALHAAETLGAEQDPKAKQSLDNARKEVAQAQRLGADGEGEKGDLHLQRAVVDADLASQLVRTKREQDKAREAWARSKSGAAASSPQ